MKKKKDDIIGLTFIYDFGTFVDGDVDIFSLQRWILTLRFFRILIGRRGRTFGIRTIFPVTNVIFYGVRRATGA